MLSCKDAMVLTDKRGRIVHCNGAWVELTGHTLTDAEGLDCDILHGSMTDSSEIRRCNGLRRAFQASVSTVVNYRKDGLMFLNSVTTSPIRGIYMSEGETFIRSYLVISCLLLSCLVLISLLPLSSSFVLSYLDFFSFYFSDNISHNIITSSFLQTFHIIARC
jgi:PAS domain S-box-containing protein